jgi:hypothetical protein
MSKIFEIMNGAKKNAFNEDEDLYKQRLSICEKCPIFVKDKLLGMICSNKLWINPETNEVSEVFKNGYMKGCGCMIRLKGRLINEHCIIKKW